MNPVERIHLHEQDFTPSDRKVESYILERLDIIASFTITDAAERIGVSKSALLRFSQKIGYAGYAEFRYSVANYLLSGSDSSGTGDGTSWILEKYSSCLSRIPNSLSDEKLASLAEAIASASAIRIFGIHESGLSARYLAYRLAALNIDAEAITSSEAFDSKADFAKPNHVHVFISISGVSTHIVSAFETSLADGATCALFTTNERAPISSRADHLVLVPSFDIDRSELFLDSQAIVMVIIDLLINRIARQLNSQ